MLVGRARVSRRLAETVGGASVTRHVPPWKALRFRGAPSRSRALGSPRDTGSGHAARRKTRRWLRLPKRQRSSSLARHRKRTPAPCRTSRLKRVRRREARRSRAPRFPHGVRRPRELRVLFFDKQGLHEPNRPHLVSASSGRRLRQRPSLTWPRLLEGASGGAAEDDAGQRGRARIDSAASSAWLRQGTVRERDAPRALAGSAANHGRPRTRPGCPGQRRPLGGRSHEQRLWNAARGARAPAGASAIGAPARALSADGAVGPRRARASRPGPSIKAGAR